jgi:mRNA-degrading endonuclease YafQ of YafQ-DinJ toxin-antitoxin module
MKKIIRRTRRFEKSYCKLQKHVQSKFLELLAIFINDHLDIRLRTHQLKGSRQHERAFSVTSDVRVIFTIEKQKLQSIITFTFVDIGTHNKIY